MSGVTAMTNGTKTDEVEISDTMKAAWLWTQGLRPVDVRGQGPRKGFVFQAVPVALLRAYVLDTARVSPMQFGQAYKSLIRLLHE
jgi:hypothetical protein